MIQEPKKEETEPSASEKVSELQKEQENKSELEDPEKSTPGLRHVAFMLKAAHSLSKYHSLPPAKVRKLTIKYFKQKEK